MILLFCSAIILGQSKEEIKSAKKQERTTQKNFKSPFWLQIYEKEPSLGLINYDPRRGISYSCRGSDCVFKMIRIVCYWLRQ